MTRYVSVGKQVLNVCGVTNIKWDPMYQKNQVGLIECEGGENGYVAERKICSTYMVIKSQIYLKIKYVVWKVWWGRLFK